MIVYLLSVPALKTILLHKFKSDVEPSPVLRIEKGLVTTLLAFLSWRWGGLLTSSFHSSFFLQLQCITDAQKEKSLAYCLSWGDFGYPYAQEPHFDFMILFPARGHWGFLFLFFE